MNYPDALRYLYGLQRFGIKMGLETIRSLCRLLDDPQNRYPAIHIGGTNGKGSTAAALASVLQSAGYRVGLYTSPHLIHFNERIRINGRDIPESKVIALTETVRRASGVDTLSPTFFEFTTAMAFTHFAEEVVDIAVIEVGMGGRLDATNVVRPILSLLTGVDYDHQDHLGQTLKEIAAEKCGILKPGVPLVTAESRDEIFNLMEKTSIENGSPVYRLNRDFSCTLHKMDLQAMEFQFRMPGYGYQANFRSGLTGRHQLSNFALALCSIRILRERGWRIDDAAVQKGIENARWNGRLEVVCFQPLILLDGAHNLPGIQSLKDFIQEVVLPSRHFRKNILVFGVLKDKAALEMLQALVPFFDEILLTRPGTDRARDPGSLALLLDTDGPKRVSIFPSVKESLTAGMTMAGNNDFILVTGSLYTVGEATAAFHELKPTFPGPIA